MRKSIFLLLFGAFVAKNEAFSQVKINLDSLVAFNDKYLKEDTVKVKMLIRLAEELKSINIEKAIEYAEESIVLSEQIQQIFWLGKAYYTKSDFLFRIGDLEEAKVFCEKSITFFEKGKYYDYIGTATMRLGSIAARTRNFENGIKYYDAANIIFDKTKNIKMSSKTTTGLANIYYELGNYEKALEFYKKSIKLSETFDDNNGLLLCYSNISNVYINMGDYNAALEYNLKSIKLASLLQDFNALAITYGNIGVMYFNINDKKESQKYKLKALEIYRKINNKSGIASEMVNLASTYEDNNQAIEELKKAVIYCEKVKNKKSLSFAHQLLSDYYSQENNYQSAYFHAIQALEITTEVRDVRNTILVNNSLANILVNCNDTDLFSFKIEPQKRYKIAEEYLAKSFEVGNNSNPKEIQYTWFILSQVHEYTNDFPKAYDAYKKYITIKDSISGDEVKKQITRKEIQYEYDKKETVLKYEQQLTTEQLEKQKLLTLQQNQSLKLKEQALALSNKEKDLAHLAYLKEQAEKQEKTQQLSLSEEREKVKEKDLSLKNLELSAQQKQNLYLGLFSILLLGGLGTLLYFYNTLKKQKNIITQQNELNEHTIAILSHDIKEPLLGVKLMLKKLNKDDPFVAQASQSLENQINSVNGILTNLLKMKKLSFAKQDKNVKANVKSVVQNVIQELNVAIQGKSLTINNELTDDLMIPIAPEKLQIIVNNLLSNAVKYSFPNQSIRIFQEGNGFCIQDFGVGLSPEQRSKVMREVTASQQGTSQERGNGLGLFLVGAMLQGEQIKILIDSPEIGGTIVKVIS